MLRRKKGKDDAPTQAAAGPDPQTGAMQVDDGAEPGDAAIAFAEAGPEPEPATTEARYEPPPPPPPAVSDAPAAGGPRGPMATPPPPPVFGDQPLTTKFWVSSVGSVLSKNPRESEQERQSQAAAEFQAAIMPGLLGLRDTVPDAASPDDALAALRQREAEYDYPVDEEGESLKGNDIFKREASVYYRIRTRFEKPRRRVGWGEPWRPPPGLVKPDPPRRRALDRGE